MVADHDEQHRQREVIVVHAALLGADAVDRIGHFAALHRLDQLALPRNDHHQHVANHDGAYHRSHMDICCTPREEMRQPVSRQHDQAVHHQAKQAFALAQGRAAQQVVHGPAHHQRAQADGNRLPRRQIGHGLIDHHRRGIEVVHDKQHGKARQPGGIGFPFEPVQFGRQLGRRDQVFLRIVKTATVHRPQFARHAALGQVGTGLGRLDRVVEPDEIKRRADPGNPRDQVQPAHQQVEPIDTV